MYLEKLEIQGFKSFANKNVLVFPGMLDKTRRGLTAVVGPNGSGKSNVADAVRWALGEQSMKSLRGKKSEDVIFSGSDKKGKLGMAEVSLFLNNEDGQAPLDYSQIVLTRRLYRNGDSEYLINGYKVRLSDIQMMLAKAKFGQKTYSVIGQGMVEGFLNTSLSERKEFFDEATGVKQYQIKRDEALNKLRASYENLNQAQMLLNEIEPRLKSLTRQVGKLQKRDELEKELLDFQLVYYRSVWHDNHDKFNKYNEEYLQIEKEKLNKEGKLEGHNKELASLEQANQASSEYESLQLAVSKLQAEKDVVTKKIARAEAELEIDLENKGEMDLSFLRGRSSELNLEIKKIEEETTALKDELSFKERGVANLMQEKDALEAEMQALNQNIWSKQKNEGGHEVEITADKISRALDKLTQAESFDDLDKIKSLIREIKKELEHLIKLEVSQEERDEINQAQSELVALTEKKENILIKISEEREVAVTLKTRLSFFLEQLNKLKTDHDEISKKITSKSGSQSKSELTENFDKLKQEEAKINSELQETREKLNKLAQKEEEKRSKLFTLQRNIQALQNEINSINFKLNEIKISSTRYETRLEDLEKDIRQNLGSLKHVREQKIEGEVNLDELQEKIRNVKKQLDHIGGIDPMVEKEYIDTKERFDFLDNQVKDLEKTIDSLEKIIKELDTTIKEIFDKEFKIISEKFEEYFKILFNGGKAKIIKVMAEDSKEDKEEDEKAKEPDEKGMLDLKKIKYLQKHNATGFAGIEIQATPPGKKITSISMLSGGERALTAIALISAIISANPSPFVVLDEVDAALDEANSERLAKILDDLSHRTQFIVITHNRASMRRAAILYGVTMGDDGVSKLLSIKLEEAKAVVKA